MCIVDGEYSTIWDETFPVARKRHVCAECDGPIPPRTKHVRIGSLYDGYWETYRMHLECRTLWTFMVNDVCGGKSAIQVYGLREEMREHEELLEHDEEGEVVGPTFEDVLDCISRGYRAMEAQAS